MEELKKEMMAVIAKYNGIRKAGRWIFPAAVAGAAMCELSEIMDKIIKSLLRNQLWQAIQDQGNGRKKTSTASPAVKSATEKTPTKSQLSNQVKHHFKPA